MIYVRFPDFLQVPYFIELTPEQLVGKKDLILGTCVSG